MKELFLTGSLNKADLIIDGIRYTVRFNRIDRIWQIKRANIQVLGGFDFMQDAVNACFEIAAKKS